eukprot:CAMPEP_0196768260 /NCGR_PEP_ID=MMETSP1095-20130614/42529_1 /TAXON_ID=96789 ORGANISM="Chromulina nebulosa, Strain UTEXLB2642" /NCGR_SAMPLE_ID=MMETSP1095 /ASSEMBLY_ACC=CAM_ASM_000446 /LENGTH=138 /DNA_ID=CAMNT_0042137573 /DNA_START=557 /DNA_END=973 /DNA_ORIENTATION=+
MRVLLLQNRQEIEGYKTEYKTAASDEDKRQLRQMITTRRETLNRLMDVKKALSGGYSNDSDKVQPVSMNTSSKILSSPSYLSFAMRVLLFQNRRYPNGHRPRELGSTTELGSSLTSCGGESGLLDPYSLSFVGQKKLN